MDGFLFILPSGRVDHNPCWRLFPSGEAAAKSHKLSGDCEGGSGFFDREPVYLGYKFESAQHWANEEKFKVEEQYNEVSEHSVYAELIHRSFRKLECPNSSGFVSVARVQLGKKLALLKSMTKTPQPGGESNNVPATPPFVGLVEQPPTGMQADVRSTLGALSSEAVGQLHAAIPNNTWPHLVSGVSKFLYCTRFDGHKHCELIAAAAYIAMLSSDVLRPLLSFSWPHTAPSAENTALTRFHHLKSPYRSLCPPPTKFRLCRSRVSILDWVGRLA
jgi:hypothetical protein